ncbi:NACHT, LRR and PYD domains-containing protein 14 isoform X2 [Eucyclogobius newberryi]|uniref:NACHT, LRR and PYD domains-containing protein 14 isoform X2 n=1 Tax=Eucyclogobius newberryi TaxID=166745 RepID=UPI003B5BBC8F
MSTVLGGELPVNVINKTLYVPVLTGCNNKGEVSLEEAIQTALCEARTVFVAGHEGSGKTTTLEMLFMNGIKGQQLQKFTHVFYFRGGDLNSLEDPISFKAFLQKGRRLPQTGPITNSEEVLFIFDDLDKCAHNLNPSVHLCSDQDQPTTVSCLVTSLLCGSLTPGASILATTKTTPTLDFVTRVRLDLLGFLKPQRDAFFRKFFTDPVTAKNALQHFETTLGFYDVSKSPRFCWTVCSIYSCLLDSGAKLPDTLTQLFVHILSHLMEKTPHKKDAMQNTVIALGNLASDCAIGSQVNFQRDKLVAFGLLSDLLLHEFVHADGEPGNAVYSWHSQLMQEFILAVSFFVDPTSETVESFVEKHKRHTTFLDVFMAGLCEQGNRTSLEEFLGSLNQEKILDFKNGLMKRCEKTLRGFNKEDHCRCFHLLYQLQSENVVKEVITPSARLGLSYGDLRLVDYVALNFVAMQLGEMEQLNLYRTSCLTEEMAEILAPTIAVSRELILKQCSFENGAVTHLASALHKGITEGLDLSYSCLNNEQFQSLCTGLSNCKLQSLDLSSCELTETSCEHLVPALSSNTSQLTVLSLFGNDIGDQGLKSLCEALRSPHNKVQELQLHLCRLTAASMKHLSTVLSSGHSKLLKVNLSRNEVGDTGVQALAKGLQHPLCKLQSLSLSDCELTEACCPALMEALMSKYCPLREMDLAVNEFGQEGALMLCNALKTPGCLIEKLGLVRCDLTEVVFVELAALLKRGSPPLKCLSVGLNKVGDQGVHHLWGALKHPSCVLEELDVEMTDLTDACVEDMCAAIKSSKTLKKLEVHNNSITNVSVPALIKVMQDSPNMEEMNWS